MIVPAYPCARLGTVIRALSVLLLMAPLTLTPTDAPAADAALHPAPAGWIATPGTFPLSRRARDVRLADTCWRTCQVDAGRWFQACLRARRQRHCVARNDAADRHCLRACRVSGGPWLNLAD